MMLERVSPGPIRLRKLPFECPKCDHVETGVIASDPFKSKTAGWLAGELGACPNSRCSILSESDSTLDYEQVFSALEYRSDTAAAAECAGLSLNPLALRASKRSQVLARRARLNLRQLHWGVASRAFWTLVLCLEHSLLRQFGRPRSPSR